MDSFEYMTGLVSVLIGLSLVELATGLQRLIRARGRVRFDALAPLSALVVALLAVQAWWGFFELYNDARTFTLGGFLPQVGCYLILFLLASAVLPSEVPAEGLDLAQHYRTNRVEFWCLLTVYFATAITLYIAALVGGGMTTSKAIYQNFAGIATIVIVALPILVSKRGSDAVILTLLLITLAGSWMSRQIM